MSKPQSESPDFGTGEVRFSVNEEDEVCVYCTQDGLQRLVDVASRLLVSKRGGHVHLEDYALLTSDSMKAVIAVFPSAKKAQ